MYNNPQLFPFLPYKDEPIQRVGRNFSKLSYFDYIPMTNDTHVVTDCSPSDVTRLVNLTAGYPRVNVTDALIANNQSLLRAQGYVRPDGTHVDYLGGSLFFLSDGGAGNRFNTNGTCGVWVEQLVLVATDDHWVSFGGANLAALHSGPSSADVRAIIDGVVLPSTSVNVRDHGLVDILIPAALGRRRLQLEVNGIRTPGMLLVNAKPVVHGFMEWRLAVEDVRGTSPSTENLEHWNSSALQDGAPSWGGFGSFNETMHCHRIGVVGFHFSDHTRYLAQQVDIIAGGRPCEFLEHTRHSRVTCCVQASTFAMVVLVGGQRSTPVTFTVAAMVMKPVVSVRHRCLYCVSLGGGSAVQCAVPFSRTNFSTCRDHLLLVPSSVRLCQSIAPRITRTDGTEAITMTGQHFVDAPALSFSTPFGEAYVPTGFEAKHGGNYDLLPVVATPPTPTPKAQPTATSEHLYLSTQTFGVTFREILPVENLLPVVPNPLLSSVSVPTTALALVRSQVPANHAPGHYLRAFFQCPIDKTLLYTDRYFIPFHTPTVTRVNPPSLPLSGGVLNLHGHSFGNGGRVLVRQRLFYNSSSVQGDRAYAGLFTVRQDSDLPS